MRQWSEHAVEVAIGNLLRTGVLIAAAVVLAGGLLYLAHHHQETMHYGRFEAQEAQLHSIAGILRGTARLDDRSLIQCGLVLLILTPVLRVAFAVVAFAMERDRMYMVVSLTVLGILLYGLFHAA